MLTAGRLSYVRFESKNRDFAMSNDANVNKLDRLFKEYGKGAISAASVFKAHAVEQPDVFRRLKRRYKVDELRVLMRHLVKERDQEIIERRRKRAEYGTGPRGGRDRAERRWRRRLKLLPVDRICPKCGRGPIIKSRSWVVRSDGSVECRSCYWKGLQKDG